MADSLDHVLKIDRLKTIGELESIRPVWNALAAQCPFRQWEWLHSWWEAFSTCGELYVLRATDEAGNVVGIAPWFLERSLARGRRVRQIGSGKACSDYQSILATASHQMAVADAIADWLVQAAQRRADRWDELDLEAIGPNDPVTDRMTDQLQQRGLSVEWRPQLACWQLPLESDWEAFVQGRSTSAQRRRLRNLKRRYVDSGRARLHRAETAADVDSYYASLVDFHQRRWARKRQTGCFAEPRFAQFLHTAAKRFHSAGQLLLTRMEIDGQPAAANLCLVQDGRCSVYQCGMDPEKSALQPGWLLNVLMLHELIEQGFDCCDYLRGDERYKLDLGARPIGQRHLRVAAPHSIARLRHQAWVTQDRLRNWADPWVEAVRG